jgi:IclR family transcriptional regulator, acetate operon repressor
MNEGNYSIRAVQRVCDILDLVQAHPNGLSLVDFAAATELPKSSVFRYLSTLEGRGYVERNQAGDYTLGLALSGDRLETIARRLTPLLVRIRDEFGETVNLGLLDGARIAYLEIVESLASIRNAPRPGEREYIHCTALGKVLAAGRPRDLVEAILRQEGMPPRTADTITDPSLYMDELELTRQRGYALDDEENEVGGRCIAITVPRIKLPIAISLSAPTARLPLEDVPRWASRMAAMVDEVADLAATPVETAPSREGDLA